MIVVTGATGIAGLQVVHALTEQGEEVRAFVRDAERAREVLGDAPELAVGDFADAASLRAALDGAEALFLSCSDDPRRVEWETGAIDAAAAAGVRRIVKLSSQAAEPGGAVAFWEWHWQVERHLRRSGVPAVILRSSFFLSNLLASAATVAEQGVLAAPAGGARIAMIDPRDVGACAAAVLTTDGHDGRTYVITGPEAITYARIADELSAATGRRVEFVDVPEGAALHAMLQAGMPAFVALQIAAIFAEAREGAAEQVTETVASLTGRAPHGVADFIRSTALQFAPVKQTPCAAVLEEIA
jgi:uncharacterized protein YbjT (DUF2867 family)